MARQFICLSTLHLVASSQRSSLHGSSLVLLWLDRLTTAAVRPTRSPSVKITARRRCGGRGRSTANVVMLVFASDHWRPRCHRRSQSLDRWLCVPIFRWVCLFSAISVRYQQMWFKPIFTEPANLLSPSSDTRSVKAGEL